MRTDRAFFFAAYLLLLPLSTTASVTADDSYFDIDFDSDLVPWARLKIQAGYFTKSHEYRGGLYQEAIDEEFEFYQCLDQRCSEWTANEKSKDEVEQGECRCQRETKHYCASWNCTQIEIAFDVSCGDFGCRDEIQLEETDCECAQEASNGKYCHKWNCTETGSDGNLEKEVYTCLEKDVTKEYCRRWKGDVASETEIESSVCQCVHRGKHHCIYWICKERGIERCQSHKGWCNRDVALGVGGGFGAAFILVSLGLAAPNAQRSERVFVLLFAFVFGCLPWTAGVVIWGGVRALLWVATIWLPTLAVSLLWIWYSTSCVFPFFCPLTSGGCLGELHTRKAMLQRWIKRKRK